MASYGALGAPRSARQVAARTGRGVVVFLLLLLCNLAVFHAWALELTNVTVTDKPITLRTVNISEAHANVYLCPAGFCSASLENASFFLDDATFINEGSALHIYSGVDDPEECLRASPPPPPPRHVILKHIAPLYDWHRKGDDTNAIVFHGAFCGGSTIVVDRYVGAQRLVLSNVSLLNGATFTVRASTISIVAVLGHIVVVFNHSALRITDSVLTGEWVRGATAPSFPPGWSADLRWQYVGAFVCQVGALLISDGSTVGMARTTVEDAVRLHVSRAAAGDAPLPPFRRTLAAWLAAVTGHEKARNDDVGSGGTLLIAHNSTLILDNISVVFGYGFTVVDGAVRRALVQASMADANSRLEVSNGSGLLLEGCRLECATKAFGAEGLLLLFQATTNHSMLVDNSRIGMAHSNLTQIRNAVSFDGRHSVGWSVVVARGSMMGILAGCNLVSSVATGVSLSAYLGAHASIVLLDNASIVVYKSTLGIMQQGILSLILAGVGGTASMVLDAASTVGVVECEGAYEGNVSTLAALQAQGLVLNYDMATCPTLDVDNGSRIGVYRSRLVTKSAVVLSWQNVAGGTLRISSGSHVGVDASNLTIAQYAVLLNASSSIDGRFRISGVGTQLGVVHHSSIHYMAVDANATMQGSSIVSLSWQHTSRCGVLIRHGSFVGIDTSVSTSTNSSSVESGIAVLFANATEGQLRVVNRSVLGIQHPRTCPEGGIINGLTPSSIVVAGDVIAVDLSAATLCNCTVDDVSVLGVITQSGWTRAATAATTTVGASKSIVRVTLSRSVRSSVVVAASSALGVVGGAGNSSASSPYDIESVRTESGCVVGILMEAADTATLCVLSGSIVGVGSNATVLLALAGASDLGVVLLNASQSNASSVVVDGSASFLGLTGSRVASTSLVGATVVHDAFVINVAVVNVEFADAGHGTVAIANGAMAGVDSLMGAVVFQSHHVVLVSFSGSVRTQLVVADGAMLGIGSSHIVETNVGLFSVLWRGSVSGATTIANGSVVGIRNTTAPTMHSTAICGMFLVNVAEHAFVLRNESFFGIEAHSTLVRSHPTRAGQGLVLQVEYSANVWIHAQGQSGIGVRHSSTVVCNGPGGRQAIALELHSSVDVALTVEDGSFVGVDNVSFVQSRHGSALLLSLRNLSSTSGKAAVALRGGSIIGARGGSRIVATYFGTGVYIVVDSVVGFPTVLLMDDRSVVGASGNASAITTVSAACLKIYVSLSPGAIVALRDAAVVGSALGGSMWSAQQSGIHFEMDHTSPNFVVLLSHRSVWGAIDFESQVVADRCAVLFDCRSTTNFSLVLHTASLLGFGNGTRGLASSDAVLLVDCRGASGPSITVNSDAFIGAWNSSVASNTSGALLFIYLATTDGARLVVQHGGGIGFRGPSCEVTAPQGDALRVSIALGNQSVVRIDHHGSRIGVDGGATVNALMNTVRVECYQAVSASITVVNGGAVVIDGAGTFINSTEGGIGIMASETSSLRILVAASSAVGVINGASVLTYGSGVLCNLADASDASVVVCDDSFVGIRGNTTNVVAHITAVRIDARRLHRALVIVNRSLVGVDRCSGSLVSGLHAVLTFHAQSSQNVSFLLIGGGDGGNLRAAHGFAVVRCSSIVCDNGVVRIDFQASSNCTLRLSNGAFVGIANSGDVAVHATGVIASFISAVRGRLALEGSSMFGISHDGCHVQEGVLAAGVNGVLHYAFATHGVRVVAMKSVDLDVRMVGGSRIGVFARQTTTGNGSSSTATAPSLTSCVRVPLAIELLAQKSICALYFDESTNASLLLSSGARIGIGLEVGGHQQAQWGEVQNVTNSTIRIMASSVREPLLLNFETSQDATLVASDDGTVVGLVMEAASTAPVDRSWNSTCCAPNASHLLQYSLAIHSTGVGAAVGVQTMNSVNLRVVFNDTAHLGIVSLAATREVAQCAFTVTSAGYDAVTVDGRSATNAQLVLQYRGMFGIRGPVAVIAAAALLRLLIQNATNATLVLSDGAVLGVCGTDNATAGTHGVRLDFVNSQHTSIEALRSSRVGFFAACCGSNWVSTVASTVMDSSCMVTNVRCIFHVGSTILALLLTNTTGTTTVSIDGGSSLAVVGCGTTEQRRSFDADGRPTEPDALLSLMSALYTPPVPPPWSATGVQVDVSGAVGSSVTISNHSFVGVAGTCRDAEEDESTTTSNYLVCVAVVVATGPTVSVNFGDAVNSSCTLRNHGAIGLRGGAVAMSLATKVVEVAMHNTINAVLMISEDSRIGSCDEDGRDTSLQAPAVTPNATAARVLWWYGRGAILSIVLSNSDGAVVWVEQTSCVGIVVPPHSRSNVLVALPIDGQQSVLQISGAGTRRLSIGVVGNSCVGVGKIREWATAGARPSGDIITPPINISFEGTLSNPLLLHRSIRVLWISIREALHSSVLIAQSSAMGVVGARIAWTTPALSGGATVVQRVNRTIVEVSSTCATAIDGSASTCPFYVQHGSLVGVEGTATHANDTIPAVLCGSLVLTFTAFAWYTNGLVVLRNDSGVRIVLNNLHCMTTMADPSALQSACSFPVAMHLFRMERTAPALSGYPLVQLGDGDVRVAHNTLTSVRHDVVAAHDASRGGYDDVTASVYCMQVGALYLSALSSAARRSIFFAVNNSVDVEVLAAPGAALNAPAPRPSNAQRSTVVTLHYTQATPSLCSESGGAVGPCLILHYACNAWNGHRLLPGDYVPSAFNNATTFFVSRLELMGIFNDAAAAETACVTTASVSLSTVLSHSDSMSACPVVPDPWLRSLVPSDASLDLQQAPLVYRHTDIWAFDCVSLAIYWLPSSVDRPIDASQISVRQLQLSSQSSSRTATMAWDYLHTTTVGANTTTVSPNNTASVNTSNVVVQLCGLTIGMPLYAPTRVFTLQATLQCAAQISTESIAVVVQSDSPPLAKEIVTVVRAATTTAVLSGTLSTGATASRIAALQRLISCLDPGEEGGGAGGILGLSIGDPQGSFARGAVWGNLMCFGAVVLLCAAATGAALAISHGALSVAVCTELLHAPSILLIAASILLPSTLSGAVSLIAEYQNAAPPSAIGDGDLVLGCVGLALCVLHIGVVAWLVFVRLPTQLQLVHRSGHRTANSGSTQQGMATSGGRWRSAYGAAMHALGSTMRGTFQWRDAPGTTVHPHRSCKRRYHLFIQDARLLWFLALDSMVSCVVGVAGGLPALVELECLVVISIAAAAYAALVAVVAALWPLNGIFNNLYAALTSFLALCSLIATAVAVAEQHEAAAVAASVAALMMGGVSAFKAILDVVLGFKGVLSVIQRLRHAKLRKSERGGDGEDIKHQHRELSVMLLEHDASVGSSNDDGSIRLSAASDAASTDSDTNADDIAVDATVEARLAGDFFPSQGNRTEDGSKQLVGHTRHGPLDDLLAAYEQHQL